MADECTVCLFICAYVLRVCVRIGRNRSVLCFVMYRCRFCYDDVREYGDVSICIEKYTGDTLPEYASVCV